MQTGKRGWVNILTAFHRQPVTGVGGILVGFLVLMPFHLFGFDGSPFGNCSF